MHTRESFTTQNEQAKWSKSSDPCVCVFPAGMEILKINLKNKNGGII